MIALLLFLVGFGGAASNVSGMASAPRKVIRYVEARHLTVGIGGRSVASGRKQGTFVLPAIRHEYNNRTRDLVTVVTFLNISVPELMPMHSYVAWVVPADNSLPFDYYVRFRQRVSWPCSYLTCPIYSYFETKPSFQKVMSMVNGPRWYRIDPCEANPVVWLTLANQGSRDLVVDVIVSEITGGPKPCAVCGVVPGYAFDKVSIISPVIDDFQNDVSNRKNIAPFVPFVLNVAWVYAVNLPNRSIFVELYDGQVLKYRSDVVIDTGNIGIPVDVSFGNSNSFSVSVFRASDSSLMTSSAPFMMYGSNLPSISSSAERMGGTFAMDVYGLVESGLRTFPEETFTQFVQYSEFSSPADTARTVVYVSTRRNLIVVSQRGTVGTDDDWDVNFNTTFTSCAEVHPLCRGFVPGGYVLEYRRLQSWLRGLISNFADVSSNFTFIVAGHSQGAALAVLTAVDLAFSFSIPKDRLFIVSFGQPYFLGDSLFNNTVSLLSKNYVQFVMVDQFGNRDPVTENNDWAYWLTGASSFGPIGRPAGTALSYVRTAADTYDCHEPKNYLWALLVDDQASRGQLGSLPPLNDFCRGAFSLSNALFPSFSPVTDIYLATDAYDPVSTCVPLARQVWFSFAPTVSQSYTFQTCTTTSVVTNTTVPDTVMTLYFSSTGSCDGSLTVVVCNDDDFNACGVGSRGSRIPGVHLTAGVIYFIVVGRFKSQTEITSSQSVVQVAVSVAPQTTTLPTVTSSAPTIGTSSITSVTTTGAMSSSSATLATTAMTAGSTTPTTEPTLIATSSATSSVTFATSFTSGTSSTATTTTAVTTVTIPTMEVTTLTSSPSITTIASTLESTVSTSTIMAAGVYTFYDFWNCIGSERYGSETYQVGQCYNWDGVTSLTVSTIETASVTVWTYQGTACGGAASSSSLSLNKCINTFRGTFGGANYRQFSYTITLAQTRSTTSLALTSVSLATSEALTSSTPAFSSTTADAPTSGATSQVLSTATGTLPPLPAVALISSLTASNAGSGNIFGADRSVSLSADGKTLAVGAPHESSSSRGINGSQIQGSAAVAGAVYVFVRNAATGNWSQQAYVKPSNTEEGFRFGCSVALSADGSTLAVGAYDEGSNASGVGGSQSQFRLSAQTGAAYVFVRSGMIWTQQEYFKASNNGDQFGSFNHGLFGWSVALSASGDTMAVGAAYEHFLSNAGGSVYVFKRTGTAWVQEVVVTGSKVEWSGMFGWSISLCASGNTLAVGAIHDARLSAGQTVESLSPLAQVGAVYIFSRSDDGLGWAQEAYLKASNAALQNWFGDSVALSLDGNALAVGATNEGSASTGVGGSQVQGDATQSGAVYVFRRFGSVWTQEAYVKPSTSRPLTFFGSSVSFVSGDIMAIGARGESQGESLSGAVFVFERSGAVWAEVAFVKVCDAQSGDQFGSALSLTPDGTMAVGAPFRDGTGKVYLFSLNSTSTFGICGTAATTTTTASGQTSTSIAAAGPTSQAVSSTTSVPSVTTAFPRLPMPLIDRSWQDVVIAIEFESPYLGTGTALASVIIDSLGCLGSRVSLTLVNGGGARVSLFGNSSITGGELAYQMASHLVSDVSAYTKVSSAVPHVQSLVVGTPSGFVLPPSAIAGIVVGSVLFVALTVLVVALIVQRRRRGLLRQNDIEMVRQISVSSVLGVPAHVEPDSALPPFTKGFDQSALPIGDVNE